MVWEDGGREPPSYPISLAGEGRFSRNSFWEGKTSVPVKRSKGGDGIYVGEAYHGSSSIRSFSRSR